jgi:hypothetical protein
MMEDETMEVEIALSDVCERDIDLLVLEEVATSPAFSVWFQEQIGLSGALCLSHASRSVRTSNGESDLEFRYTSDAGQTLVLIENKVDAVFQPQQAVRYADRARAHMTNGPYANAKTVLLAPSKYIGIDGAKHGFDMTVSYESLREWFFGPGSRANPPRTAYKLKLLELAIERSRTGWQAIPHQGVQNFWRAYRSLANDIAPELAMPETKATIPERSSFITFLPPSLPAGVVLRHKVRHGHVDLLFRGMGRSLARIDQVAGDTRPPGSNLVKAGNSSALRLQVDRVDISKEAFSDCEPSMRRALHCAASLLEWYRSAGHTALEEVRRQAA